MNEDGREVVCIWGGRKNLKINGGEVHGCPLKSQGGTGTIDLTDCKYCASHVKIT